MDLIDLLPETLPYNPKKQYIIDHSGMVNKSTYHVLIGLFTAVALVAAITRLVIQIKYRHKLSVDDYLVMFAAACLAVQTGILYHYSEMVYIFSVLSTDLSSYALFTRSEILRLPDILKWSNIFLCFAWTVNYTIKLSFLALFWRIIRNVSKRLTQYWWFVLVWVVLSWLYNVIENFIICGANDSNKCYPSPRFMVPMAVTTSLVDILSDLMIVSIPIMLLYKSQMRLSQRLRILAFLCLSVFMATFCLIRTAGRYRDPYGKVQVHVDWTTLTLHMESSVAVLMGGVTAFRTVFASLIREREHRNPERSGSHLYYRLRELLKRGTPSRSSDMPQSRNDKSFLTAIRVGGTLNGLTTFMRRHKREPGPTTVSDNASWNESVPGSVYNYHAFKISEKRGMRGNPESNLDSMGKESTASTPSSSLPERPMPTLQMHNWSDR